MLDGNGGYCDGDEEGFNGEPYTIGPDGKRTHKYPHLLITEYDFDGDYNIRYPFCKKCRQQHNSNKVYNSNIVFTLNEPGLIYQSIYYDRGNLIVIKNCPESYYCNTCLDEILWFLYRFDNDAGAALPEAQAEDESEDESEFEKNYRYEIIPSGNTDFKYSLTVLPYKKYLKNIINMVIMTEHIGGVLHYNNNIYIPKVFIREQVGEMIILADGLGAMGFEGRFGELIILDEFGQNVEYDKYEPIANDGDYEITYGNEFFKIILSPYSREAESIILSGKHTKPAVRIEEENDE